MKEEEEKEEVCLLNVKGPRSRNRSNRAIMGDTTPAVSSNIKEEAEDCPIKHNYEDCETKRGLNIITDTTPAVSSNIKEEAEDCPMMPDNEDCETKRSINIITDTPLGVEHCAEDTEGSPDQAQLEEGQDGGVSSGPSCPEVPATAAPTTSQATAIGTPASRQSNPSRRSPATRVRLERPTQKSMRRLQSQPPAGAPSRVLFGGLEQAMLRIQLLKLKKQRLMNLKLTQGFRNITKTMAENQCRLDARFDALTGTIADLAKELAEERVQHSRMERRSGHKMDTLSRAIGRLAHETTQHTKRTLELQVEKGHYSGDVSRALQQITVAVETLQTNMFDRGGPMVVADSEVSSCCSVSSTETPPMHRSSGRQVRFASGSSGQAKRKGRK